MATASNNARRHPAPDDGMERRWPPTALLNVALDSLIRLIRFFNYFCKSLATKTGRHKKRNMKFKLLSKREESIAEKIGDETFPVHKVSGQIERWVQEMGRR
jgi:hypothetical protein